MARLRPYQRRAADAIVARPCHGLFLDPGLGKTLATLTAFSELREALDVTRMLVIAPLQVCKSTWPEQVEEWGFPFHVQHIDRRRSIEQPADIYTINPEGLHKLFGKKDRAQQKWVPGPWSTWRDRPELLVVDESTRFKSFSGVQARTLRRYLDDFARRVILTGTPAANSLQDLFGQVYLLDKGNALGRTLKEFRERYCIERVMKMGHRRFTVYDLQPGADQRIMQAVAPLVTTLRAKDWLDLPGIVYTDRSVVLPTKVRELLSELGREGVADFDGQTLTALEGRTAKLRQAISGVMYDHDQPWARKSERTWTVLHTAKLNALFDLLDELGRPAIVAYQFVCEREEILARARRTGRSVGVIGGGQRKDEAPQAIRKWNAGRLDVLLVHPQSAGHGLNLQAGSDAIVWYSLPWSLEWYQQLNRRLWRSGQKAERVLIYHLVAQGTLDRRVARVLRDRDATQERLLEALKEELGG